MVRILAWCAVAVLVMAMVPQAIRAQTVPLRVNDCSIVSRDNAFEVMFTNVGAKTTESITFAVFTASGFFRAIPFKGTVAPQASAKAKLQITDEFYYLQVEFRCVAASATFTDGTAWQNPSVPAVLSDALPQAPQSHIVVNECWAVVVNPDSPPELHVTFTNTAGQPATNIDFGFVENGVMVWHKVEGGTFSPGVSVTRTLGPGRREPENSAVLGSDLYHQRCVILGTTFADGTTWTNPSPPPAAHWVPIDPAVPQSGGHLTVTGCIVDEEVTLFGRTWNVHYRNDGDVQAVAVDFALVSNGAIVGTGRHFQNIDPSGQYVHQFWVATVDKVPNPICVPTRILYATGEEWTNPLIAAPSHT